MILMKFTKISEITREKLILSVFDETIDANYQIFNYSVQII